MVISFNLSLAIFLPLAGWSADRFGRRRLFVASVLAVVAGSIGAALAPSLAALVGFRVLQGIGGAAIVPCVMGLITDLYGEQQRSRALGLWAAANGLGQTIGPPLGGVLASWLSWRWVFFPAVPLGAAAVIGALRFVPVSRPRVMHLEWVGAVLLTVGVGLVVSAVTVIADFGASSVLVLVLGGGGIIGLAGFVAATKSAKAPFIDPQLWREPSFVRSILAVGAQMVCLGATLFAVPLYLTRSGHRSTAVVGVVVFALPATMTALAPVSGIVAARLGARRVLRGGMGVLIVAEAIFAALVGPRVDIALVVAALVVCGVGVAFVQTPAATGATRSAAGRVGTGLGLFNLVRFAGATLGVAWVTIALTATREYRLVFGVCAVVAALGLSGTWLGPRGTDPAVVNASRVEAEAPPSS